MCLYILSIRYVHRATDTMLHGCHLLKHPDTIYVIFSSSRCHDNYIFPSGSPFFRAPLHFGACRANVQQKIKSWLIQLQLLHTEPIEETLAQTKSNAKYSAVSASATAWSRSDWWHCSAELNIKPIYLEIRAQIRVKWVVPKCSKTLREWLACRVPRRQ